MKGKYKVKIINGNNSLSWYYDQVGAVLFVEYFSDDLFSLMLSGVTHYLRKKDCEILERPKPSKNSVRLGNIQEGESQSRYQVGYRGRANLHV